MKQLVLIPRACPNRNCRSQTWNITNSELETIKKTQRRNLSLGPAYRTGIKKSVPILDKYRLKKTEKIPLVICAECELFYYDQDSLERHHHRRHHGMCSVCHSSNVYVVRIDGMNTCKICAESRKK